MSTIEDALIRRGWSKIKAESFLDVLTEEQTQLLIDAEQDRQTWQEAMDRIADEHNNKA